MANGKKGAPHRAAARRGPTSQRAADAARPLLHDAQAVVAAAVSGRARQAAPSSSTSTCTGGPGPARGRDVQPGVLGGGVAGHVVQRFLHDVEDLRFLVLRELQAGQFVDELQLGPGAAAEGLRAGAQACTRPCGSIGARKCVSMPRRLAWAWLTAPTQFVEVGPGRGRRPGLHGVAQQRQAHLHEGQRLRHRVVHLGGHQLAFVQQRGTQVLAFQPRVVQRQAQQFAHGS
jgi:hypothetical protein